MNYRERSLAKQVTQTCSPNFLSVDDIYFECPTYSYLFQCQWRNLLVSWTEDDETELLPYWFISASMSMRNIIVSLMTVDWRRWRKSFPNFRDLILWERESKERELSLLMAKKTKLLQLQLRWKRVILYVRPCTSIKEVLSFGRLVALLVYHAFNHFSCTLPPIHLFIRSFT